MTDDSFYILKTLFTISLQARSTNRGLPLISNSVAITTWSFIGAGLSNIEFYDSTAAMTSPNVVIGGTQDNGTLHTREAAPPGIRSTTAMVRQWRLTPTNPLIMYSMHQNQDSIERRIGPRVSWQCIACSIPLIPICPFPHFQVHPTAPSIVLTSCSSLWRANSP
jgi:hypothetical protein